MVKSESDLKDKAAINLYKCLSLLFARNFHAANITAESNSVPCSSQGFIEKKNRLLEQSICAILKYPSNFPCKSFLITKNPNF